MMARPMWARALVVNDPPADAEADGGARHQLRHRAHRHQPLHQIRQEEGLENTHSTEVGALSSSSSSSSSSPSSSFSFSSPSPSSPSSVSSSHPVSASS